MCADAPPRRVAVTGASGFLGRAVVRHLRTRGWEVVPYGRRAAAHVEPDVARGYVQWDLADGALANPPVVDAVVHCAGTVTDWGPRELFEQVNVEGTRAVVDTWPDARFVHISTASVYDPFHRGAQLHERDADPTDPAASERVRWLNDYGRTKRLAEHVVAGEARNWVILRPHVVYGPGDTQLAPRMVERIRRGRLVLPGNGRVTRVSVVHVDNLVHAVALALGSDVRGAFNIVDDYAPTVHEAVTALLDALAIEARVVYVPSWLATAAAVVAEPLWKLARARTAPAATRYAVAHMARSNVLPIDDAVARLGYAPQRRYPESFATITLG